MKTKILIICPHLSTGGAPQFTLHKIKNLIEDADLYCVEYRCISSIYVVQRNSIINLLKEKFTALDENDDKLIEIIRKVSPDFIFIEEIAETFLSESVINFIYDSKRTYKIYETTHSSIDRTYNKKVMPDKFIFVSEYSKKMYEKFNVPSEVIEYPVTSQIKLREFGVKSLSLDPDYKHVLNIALFTPGKNQGYAIEMAKALIDYKVKFHFVGNTAENFKDYWEPLLKDLPENCILWGEQEKVSQFFHASDLFLFPSKFELNPIVIKEALGYDIPIMMFNLDTYVGKYNNNKNVTYLTSDINKDCDQLLKLLDLDKDSISKKEIQHLSFSKQLDKLKFRTNYIKGAFVEILGNNNIKDMFTVQFFNNNTSELLFESNIGVNCWTKCNFEYFIPWNIKIYNDKKLIFEETLNLEKRRVYISIDSSSLGDNLAWMPHIEEFRKLHNCSVTVSTFKNFLFEEAYPEITFIRPGETVPNIIAQYTIGWFNDKYKTPVDPKTLPLQGTCYSILNVPPSEIVPEITRNYEVPIKDNNLITIAPNSTAGCKEWPINYWQELVNILIEKGYKVYNVSKEPNKLKNVNTCDSSLSSTMEMIDKSKFFIGLSSGLSWLSWALDTTVVMISNFSEESHEFSSNCIRITNTNVCNSCWNNINFKFDKNDWNWCPINKGTPNQFICHKSITPKMVIEKINSLL